MEVVGLRRIATRIQVHLVLGGRATAWSDTLRHSATFHGPWIARSSFAERTFLAQVSILVLQLDLLFNYVVISFPCLRVIWLLVLADKQLVWILIIELIYGLVALSLVGWEPIVESIQALGTTS
jgi:hypothetical protein